MTVVVLQNSTLEQSTISIAIKLINPVASLISMACYWSLKKKILFFFYLFDGTESKGRGWKAFLSCTWRSESLVLTEMYTRVFLRDQCAAIYGIIRQVIRVYTVSTIKKSIYVC